LLILSALFSGSETAFFSLSKTRLNELASRKGLRNKTIVKLLKDPQRLIITILVGNETVNTIATVIATTLAVSYFGQEGVGVAIGTMFVVLLLFGELMPKTLALNYYEQFVQIAARPLDWFSRVIYPVRRVLRLVVDGLLVPFSRRPAGEQPLTEEEFRTLLETAPDEGLLKEQEQEMIRNVLELTETSAREIMVPRERIFWVSAEETIPEVLEKLKHNLRSRIPVYDRELGRFIGILYTKDLLGYKAGRKPEGRLRDLLHPVYVVREDMMIDDLLREFQRRRVHLALVEDETGEVCGLVSLHDVLEELFGKMGTEAEASERLIRRLGRNTYRVSALMHIADFNQTLGESLPTGEFETLGGFLQELIGHAPRRGERMRYGRLEFIVFKLHQGRIQQVVVRRLPEEPGGGGRQGA